MITKSIKNYQIQITDKSDWPSRNVDAFFKLKQVHSNKVLILENSEIPTYSVEADWIVSCLENYKIWVVVADCNWIVLMWKKWFGLVHAGWKWLKHWIIENTIRILSKKWESIEDLFIFAWPSIRQCCYEVWEEFSDYFNMKYLSPCDNWKFMFDMIWVIRDKLMDLWIIDWNIEIFDECTKCSWRYFSYRNNDIDSRNIIWVEKIC